MSPFPPSLLGKQTQMVLDFGWCFLCLVSSNRVLRIITSMSVFVYFIIPNEYVSMGIARVFIPLKRFLLFNSVWHNFLNFVMYSFLKAFFIVSV